MNKIEIIAPAGNLDKLKSALDSGADSVTVGGKFLNISSGTECFSDVMMEQAVKIVKNRGKKIFVSLNAVPQNEELDLLPEYIKFLDTLDIDGVIISDLGVFQCVREFSNLAVTVQTHSSNTNYMAAEMWKNLGAERIVIDRDLSSKNIGEIITKVPGIKVELFVQGPVSLAISRRPILSNFSSAKSLESETIQNSRYFLREETRPNEKMEIYEDKYGTSIYSARDLCAIESLELLLSLGVTSIKIEGGMRDINYLNTAVSVYREAVDLFTKGKFIYNNQWREKLESCSEVRFFNWFEEVK